MAPLLLLLLLPPPLMADISARQLAALISAQALQAQHLWACHESIHMQASDQPRSAHLLLGNDWVDCSIILQRPVQLQIWSLLLCQAYSFGHLHAKKRVIHSDV